VAETGGDQIDAAAFPFAAPDSLRLPLVNILETIRIVDDKRFVRLENCAIPSRSEIMDEDK
jgi:hypothetical protein